MVLFQKLAAEYLGTMFLVGVGTGAMVGVMAFQGDTAQLTIALGFGLALMLGLYALAGISGGHFNPAVSLAAFLDRRIGLTDMLAYWVAQVAGGLTASALLAWVYNREIIAQTTTSPGGLSELAGFFTEAALTAVFIFAILVLAKSQAHTKFIGMGVALATVHLVGIPLTGASVNPARTFAPALVGGTLDGFWIYIAGPALGAIIAWALYKIVVEGDLKLGDDLMAVKDSAVGEVKETL